MSFEFFKNILIAPVISNFDNYFLNLIILLIIYILISYLSTILLLQTPIYKTKKEYIDLDLRKKLCWSIAYSFATFCVTGNIVYIWLKELFSTSIDLLPHWSTLTIILSIWGIIQLSIRKALSNARKVIPV